MTDPIVLTGPYVIVLTARDGRQRMDEAIFHTREAAEERARLHRPSVYAADVYRLESIRVRTQPETGAAT